MIERRSYHLRIVIDQIATPYEARKLAMEINKKADEVERNPGWAGLRGLK